MRSLICLGSLAALLSCSPPLLDQPTDGLKREAMGVVHGRAADATGPLVNETITLKREGADFATAVTDSNGEYTFTLRGSDTWSQPPDYDGGFRYHQFQVALPTVAGVTSSLKFTVHADLELPLLSRWKAEQQTTESTSGDLTLIVPGFDSDLSASSFETPLPFSTVVAETATRTTRFVFSAFEREDFEFPMATVLSERQLGVFVETHTQPLVLPRGAKVPLSRGARCELPGLVGCPLTDGSAERFSLGASHEVTFTFSAPQTLSRACFHRLIVPSLVEHPPIEVLGSVDGVTFVPLVAPQPIDDLNRPEGVLLDANAPAVTQVRVRVAAGTHDYLDYGSEVSFF